MNNIRRKEIGKITTKLYDIREELENIYCEEYEAFSNIPENLEASERYSKAEEACDRLEAALNCFDELIDFLDNAMI